MISKSALNISQDYLPASVSNQFSSHEGVLSLHSVHTSSNIIFPNSERATIREDPAFKILEQNSSSECCFPIA